LAPEEFWKS
jgi:hypothetical protein